MLQMDQAFSELEMCKNVLAALPLELSMTYWASQDQNFPTDLGKLEEDLVLCEAQVCQQKMLLDELRVKVGMKPKNKKNRAKDHQEARIKNSAD